MIHFMNIESSKSLKLLPRMTVWIRSFSRIIVRIKPPIGTTTLLQSVSIVVQTDATVPAGMCWQDRRFRLSVQTYPSTSLIFRQTGTWFRPWISHSANFPERRLRRWLLPFSSPLSSEQFINGLSYLFNRRSSIFVGSSFLHIVFAVKLSYVFFSDSNLSDCACHHLFKYRNKNDCKKNQSKTAHKLFHTLWIKTVVI